MEEPVVMKKLFHLNCITDENQLFCNLSKDQLLEIVHNLFVIYDHTWDWKLKDNKKKDFLIIQRNMRKLYLGHLLRKEEDLYITSSKSLLIITRLLESIEIRRGKSVYRHYRKNNKNNILRNVSTPNKYQRNVFTNLTNISPSGGKFNKIQSPTKRKQKKTSPLSYDSHDSNHKSPNPNTVTNIIDTTKCCTPENSTEVGKVYITPSKSPFYYGTKLMNGTPIEAGCELRGKELIRTPTVENNTNENDEYSLPRIDISQISSITKDNVLTNKNEIDEKSAPTSVWPIDNTISSENFQESIMKIADSIFSDSNESFDKVSNKDLSIDVQQNFETKNIFELKSNINNLIKDTIEKEYFYDEKIDKDSVLKRINSQKSDEIKVTITKKTKSELSSTSTKQRIQNESNSIYTDEIIDFTMTSNKQYCKFSRKNFSNFFRFFTSCCHKSN